MRSSSVFRLLKDRYTTASGVAPATGWVHGSDLQLSAEASAEVSIGEQSGARAPTDVAPPAGRPRDPTRDPTCLCEVHGPTSLRVESDALLVESSPDLAAGHPGAAYHLEPVVADGRPRLLLVTGEGAARVRINGQVAGTLEVLEPGDELVVGARVLEVALYQGDTVFEATAAELVGRKCQLCRVPFGKGDLVYVCPHCATPLHRSSTGSGLHTDPHADPRAEPLECALSLSACPSCERRVLLAPGYAHALRS